MDIVIPGLIINQSKFKTYIYHWLQTCSKFNISYSDLISSVEFWFIYNEFLELFSLTFLIISIKSITWSDTSSVCEQPSCVIFHSASKHYDVHIPHLQFKFIAIERFTLYKKFSSPNSRVVKYCNLKKCSTEKNATIETITFDSYWITYRAQWEIVWMQGWNLMEYVWNVLFYEWNQDMV